MKLYVKTLVGKTHDLEVEASQSIRSVKVKLGDPSQIHLMLAGMLLEDNKCLSDYGLGNQSTIHLVYRLKSAEEEEKKKKEEEENRRRIEEAKKKEEEENRRRIEEQRRVAEHQRIASNPNSAIRGMTLTQAADCLSSIGFNMSRYVGLAWIAVTNDNRYLFVDWNLSRREGEHKYHYGDTTLWLTIIDMHTKQEVQTMCRDAECAYWDRLYPNSQRFTIDFRQDNNYRHTASTNGQGCIVI